MADAVDSKSTGILSRVGSTPTFGIFFLFYSAVYFVKYDESPT